MSGVRRYQVRLGSRPWHITVPSESSSVRLIVSGARLVRGVHVPPAARTGLVPARPSAASMANAGVNNRVRVCVWVFFCVFMGFLLLVWLGPRLMMVATNTCREMKPACGQSFSAGGFVEVFLVRACGPLVQ